ncbi:integrator complex subunit 12-like isoform X1 [Penaeus monodon]|uniref:integrator complex subunit 12-like isoform X1 n=1 Tax=Penaeus monodon TaxID=6687 RepID=UPI0018A74EE0|nr:integrator complex subunit 12-like isoform X1 [Penaeus monodon]XP_037798620.1 integrator complex subunit 12-like isoform X1 [Penaeus monodon]
MANLELDPMFRRGLRLLHSRSRDSVDQLKALLDEAIRQRQGKPVHMDSFSLRRESPIPRSKPGSPIPVSLSKREEIKKDMERKINLQMRDDDGLGAKRPRLDSPSAFKSHTPSPTPSLKSESSSRSRKSDESESDTDMNDIAMEIMDGINCTVCKSFEVTPRNRLVECQECHSLYHQECHKPPVTDQDVNDPRLVWYCAKCAKSLKKQTSIVSATGGGTLSGTRGVSGGGMPSMASGSKSGSSLSRPTPSPTKGLGLSRLSPFTNLSSASGRTLGANNGGNSNNGNNKSLSSSSSSSGKSSAPSNSMITAERRMHLMKKKAAAKMAEKRKL